MLPSEAFEPSRNNRVKVNITAEATAGHYMSTLLSLA
jgi:hypothetical protein